MSSTLGVSAAVTGMTFLDELVNQGVRDVVVSPGSRSTPLAIAAARERRLTLHVKIDERVAAFYALGLVKGQRIHSIERPVAVICSSGTAVANHSPAIQEASKSGMPIIFLTADRPEELHEIGANQTIDQQNFHGNAVRWFHNISGSVPLSEAGLYLRRTAGRAVSKALGSNNKLSGPVHINFMFRDPLIQTDIYATALPGTAPKITHPVHTGPGSMYEIVGLLSATRRTVVVAGEGTSLKDQKAIEHLAGKFGWPVLAEPTSGARKSQACITMGSWLTALPGFAQSYAPEVVLVTGHPTISGSVSKLFESAREVIQIDPWNAGWNAGGRATHIFQGHAQDLIQQVVVEPNFSWLDMWQRAEETARLVLRDVLKTDESEYKAMQHILDFQQSEAKPSLLMCSSSTPIRTLDHIMPADHNSVVLSNRGVSGIDGFLSTSIGAAVGAYLPTICVVGDLAFLHDMGAMVSDFQHEGVDLTIVVFNNDGGAIFNRLPHLQGVDRDVFTKLFTTPHGLSTAAIANAMKWPAITIKSVNQLPEALRTMPRTSPIRVIEVDCHADMTRETMVLIRESIAANIDPEENASF